MTALGPRNLQGWTRQRQRCNGGEMQWRVVHCVVARRREECGIDTQRPRSEPGREGAGEGCRLHETRATLNREPTLTAGATGWEGRGRWARRARREAKTSKAEESDARAGRVERARRNSAAKSSKEGARHHTAQGWSSRVVERRKEPRLHCAELPRSRAVGARSSHARGMRSCWCVDSRLRRGRGPREERA